MGLRRFLPLLAFVAGCHGFFGDRTTDEDVELNSFAEARYRAATYYDGGDYVRAATQYQKALEIRPRHVATRLGYAYSLMATDVPSHLIEARRQLAEELGEQRDEADEVKRVYGLGKTCLSLATHYQRRAYMRENEGRIGEAQQDFATARDYARESITHFEAVLQLDQRVSSLRPHSHLGIAHAHIVLGGRDAPEHLDDAVAHIQEYSRIAQNAREFWRRRKESLLAPEPAGDDRDQGDPQRELRTEAERKLVEERIDGTIRKEATVRRILVETYMYLNRFQDAIAECNRIEALDPGLAEIYYARGSAYAHLDPPNYAAALVDLKRYRKMLDPASLTERDVRLNIMIREFEERLRGSSES